MDRHDWLVGIVDDLAEYAKLSDLKALAPQLERLRQVVVEELSPTSSDADGASRGPTSAKPFGSGAGGGRGA